MAAVVVRVAALLPRGAFSRWLEGLRAPRLAYKYKPFRVSGALRAMAGDMHARCATFRWIAHVSETYGLAPRVCIAAMHLVARSHTINTRTRETDRAELALETFEALLIAARLEASCTTINLLTATAATRTVREHLRACDCACTLDDAALIARVRATRARMTCALLYFGVSGLAYDLFWRFNDACTREIARPVARDVVDGFACAFAMMPLNHAIDEVAMATILAIAYHASQHAHIGECDLVRLLDDQAVGEARALFDMLAGAPSSRNCPTTLAAASTSCCGTSSTSAPN